MPTSRPVQRSKLIAGLPVASARRGTPAPRTPCKMEQFGKWHVAAYVPFMKPLPGTFTLYRSDDDRLLIVVPDDWSLAAGRTFGRIGGSDAGGSGPVRLRSEAWNPPLLRQFPEMSFQNIHPWLTQLGVLTARPAAFGSLRCMPWRGLRSGTALNGTHSPQLPLGP